VCQCFGTLDIHVLSGEKAGERALNYPAADHPRRGFAHRHLIRDGKGASEAVRTDDLSKNEIIDAVASAILMTAESERKLRSNAPPDGRLAPQVYRDGMHACIRISCRRMNARLMSTGLIIDGLDILA